MSAVHLLALGGTISSVRDGGAHAKPTLDAAALLGGIDVGDLAVTAETVARVASPDLSLADVERTLEAAEAAVAAGADGIVVTVGTDALEEVAFLWELLWRHPQPFVVTGAMRNASLLGADGPANLAAALLLAGSAEAVGRGVLVVFNDEIHAASRVSKQHSSRTDTFTATVGGAVGAVIEGRISFFAPAAHRRSVERPDRWGRVPVIAQTLGDGAIALAALEGQELDGLVVVGSPGGHLSAEFAEHDAFAAILARVPVVVCARAGHGETLRSTYDGFAGSEAVLQARGVLLGGRLPAAKARLVLAALTGSGAARSEVEAAFREHAFVASA